MCASLSGSRPSSSVTVASAPVRNREVRLNPDHAPLKTLRIVVGQHHRFLPPHGCLGANEFVGLSMPIRLMTAPIRALAVLGARSPCSIRSIR